MWKMLIICCSVIVFSLSSVSGVSEAKQRDALFPQRAPEQRCGGYGCDGSDPAVTGCASDAYTVRTAFIENGYVWLRYSPTCKTNWATTHSTIGRTSLMAKITRASDGRTYTRRGVGNSLTSLQVYVGDILADACGKIGSGASGCTGFFLANMQSFSPAGNL